MLQLEIIGNIGNDAEVKQINGKTCVSFNVAHSDTRRDANGNEIKTTTWVGVLMSGDGGKLTQYLKKGAKVFVRGRMSVKPYQDRNNAWQCAINVYSNDVVLCDLKTPGATAPNQQPPMQQPQAPTGNGQTPGAYPPPPANPYYYPNGIPGNYPNDLP